MARGGGGNLSLVIQFGIQETLTLHHFGSYAFRKEDYSLLGKQNKLKESFYLQSSLDDLWMAAVEVVMGHIWPAGHMLDAPL